VKKVDRRKDFGAFSRYMTSEYLQRTVDKYQGAEEKLDLMSFTPSKICIWNILKYALRLWNDKGKEHDLEKIAHYAQIAWTKNKEEEE